MSANRNMGVWVLAGTDSSDPSAERFFIVAAQTGEEALALAKKQLSNTLELELRGLSAGSSVLSGEMRYGEIREA